MMPKIRVLIADDHTVLRDGLHALLNMYEDVEVVGKAADQRRGWGILGMRERASLLGGTFQITSEPASGTRLKVTVPLQGDE